MGEKIPSGSSFGNFGQISSSLPRGQTTLTVDGLGSTFFGASVNEITMLATKCSAGVVSNVSSTSFEARGSSGS